MVLLLKLLTTLPRLPLSKPSATPKNDVRAMFPRKTNKSIHIPSRKVNIGLIVCMVLDGSAVKTPHNSPAVTIVQTQRYT